MKSLTIFGLLVYWSIIIIAPVVSNDINFDNKSARIIKPLKKPLN